MGGRKKGDRSEPLRRMRFLGDGRAQASSALLFPLSVVSWAFSTQSDQPVMLELNLVQYPTHAERENIRFSALYQSEPSKVMASNGLCGKSLTAALLDDPSSGSAPADASSEHLVIHLALLTGSFELLRWTTDDELMDSDTGMWDTLTLRGEA